MAVDLRWCSPVAAHLVVPLVVVGVLVGVNGCSNRPTVYSVDNPDGGGGSDGSGGAFDASRLEIGFFPHADGAPCQQVSCTPVGGRYCGMILDGCNGTLDCGACPDGQACGTGALANICVSADPNCKALTCDQPTGQLCGKVGDGCGRPLDCPTTCPTGQTCGSETPNVCGGPPDPNCKPVTCDQTNGRYCDKIGDGCGRVLDCGACPGGMACGADGTPNVCPGGAGPCMNLECQQTTCTKGDCKEKPCAAGTSTTVSGTVYDPAGKLPLYNVVVYVPNAALDPITTGATCDSCLTTTGSPLVTTLTDAKGQFKLDNVPVGKDIPLVLQVGKWRREITIPAVTACVDTPLVDKDKMRLPRSKSEGNIPKMALSTGGADALECLLRKIGIDDTEFTPEAGTGRVNLFHGVSGIAKYAATLNGGAALTVSTSLWSTADALKKYDIVLLSCEGGGWHLNDKVIIKGPGALQAMTDYSNAGGRVFASHWHNYWIQKAPAPVSTLATWQRPSDANPLEDLADPFIGTIDETFPKGMSFAEWLVNVKASTTRGQLPISGGKDTLRATVPPKSQQWVYGTDAVNGNIPSVQYMSFNTPADKSEEEQCGRVVFSDIHLASGVGDKPAQPFPSGCLTTDLSAQEKALEFMLFDLSACVQPDTKKPMPPKPPELPKPPASPPPPPPPPPPQPIP